MNRKRSNIHITGFSFLSLICMVIIVFPFASVIGNPDVETWPRADFQNDRMIQPPEDPLTIEGLNTPGENQPPIIESIMVNINEEMTELNDGDELRISEEEVYIVFVTGNAQDDFTSFNKLEWNWNITAPSGQSIKKNYRSFDIEITEPGSYEISLTVADEQGGVSNPVAIRIIVEEEVEVDPPVCLTLVFLPALIMIVLLSGLVILRKRVSK